MALQKPPVVPPPDEPVLYTPPGAAPRSLRSDPFEKNRDARPLREPAANGAVHSETAESSADTPRSWDFAMPAPQPPKAADPHIGPDVNWRRHVGLRPPPTPPSFPTSSRERFCENWERLAAEPAPDRRSRMHRALLASPLTRWLFHRGQLDFGNAFGLLLFAALLAAAVIYGRKFLAGPPPQTSLHSAPGQTNGK